MSRRCKLCDSTKVRCPWLSIQSGILESLWPFHSWFKFCPMYERKIPITLDCGLDLLREVTAGKWKISLLYFVGQGLHRPSQLHQRLPDATPRVLNLQLKQLLGHELLRKHTVSIRPLNVEYHLTALGESLLPLLSALGHWGDAHQDKLRRVVEQSLAAMPQEVE